LQICRDLDGIPLAIELAAARVNVMGVEQIAVRLADRFHLLSVGSRTALPRQKTLRALIDWSYDLLADPERRLLARLSVFVGGWSLEAAEAVGTETDAWAVLDALTQLVAKSLVNAEDAPNAAGTGDAKRYRLLETVRTYAREKLAGEDELATRSRHLEFFLQLAQTALPHLRGPESAQWVHRLDTEHDNLRAALDWASQSPQRHAAGLRLATTLHRFWYQRGYLVEGLQRLEQFLKVGDAQTTEPAIRAPALLAASALAHFQGDLQRATSLSDQGRSLYQSLGDAEGITLCLRASARVAVQSGDYARAEELLVEIVERLRPLKDPDGLVAQGEAAHNLALALVYQGYHHRALPYLEQATALARESGDRRQMAVMLAAKAFISIFGGAYDEADSACRQALPIFEEFGDQYRIANAHYLIAMNQTWRGDIDSAIKSCDHTLALLSQIKEKWLTVLTLILRGQLAVRQGDLALGAELCEKSLKLAPVGGDHRGADVALAVLGVIAAQKGDLPRAANLFAQSLRLTQRLPDWRHAAECMEVLAGVAVGNNQAERAARLLGAAAALREQLGCPVPTVEKSDLEKTRASARQMLGDQAFAAARDAGAALDRAQAVHLALDGVG
jgi:tetratricopeptide (TPR) repeat protein